jgi:hypothetical protein
MAKTNQTYQLPEDPEVLEWWSLTPAQRFVESQKLWATFLALGGSLDPEFDWQSPFYFAETSSPLSPHGRSSLHPVRRRRIQSRRGHRRAGQRSRRTKKES